MERRCAGLNVVSSRIFAKCKRLESFVTLCAPSLLRQYLPKGIDLSDYSQPQLNAIARQLNERPRKTLGFHTPAEMFSERVALTS